MGCTNISILEDPYCAKLTEFAVFGANFRYFKIGRLGFNLKEVGLKVVVNIQGPTGNYDNHQIRILGLIKEIQHERQDVLQVRTKTLN